MEQAVDAKLIDMDLHQEEYHSDHFAALFNVLRGIGDTSQSPFVEGFVHDPSRKAHNAAETVFADILRGNKVLCAVGY